MSVRINSIGSIVNVDRLNFITILLLTLISLSTHKVAFTQGSTDKISEAIAICREKLNADPHFPKVQHSLAQLLDSQLSSVYEKQYNDVSQPERDRISEVIQLYHAVGKPSLEVDDKRLPPPKIRYESLVRAGTISRDYLFDTPQAISYFLLAVGIEGIDDSALTAVFQQVMPLLLSKEETIDDAVTLVGISVSDNDQSFINDGRHHETYLQTAYQLCDFLSSKCPDETIVDEFKGATLRKMQQSQLAYQSYRDAMTKAKHQYDSCAVGADEIFSKLINFVRTSILAAAAGGEAGLDSDECLSFLLDAESIATQVFKSSNHEEEAKNALIEQLVDLCNNMGIIEKKREQYNQAYMYFRKALDIKPDDGHALVQLASIADKTSGNDNDVLSDVKSLEPGYVSALFDGYSARFESELVDKLQYRGHVFVYDAMKAALSELKIKSTSVKQIVELGCGTGLLGAIIAHEMPSTNLIGVDISQRMVEVSRARQTSKGDTVYSNVVHGDALQYLSTLASKSCDCILASDVFIYIGEMSELLSKSSKCLVDLGIIAFTVEGYDDKASDSGIRLLKSGRFGHSRKYIEKVANENGFKLHSWKDCVLRQQGGEDVKGAVVVLLKTR